jgi:hypothetical protein
MEISRAKSGRHWVPMKIVTYTPERRRKTGHPQLRWGRLRYCGVICPCGSYWSAETSKRDYATIVSDDFSVPSRATPPLPSPQLRSASPRTLLGDAVNTGLRNTTELCIPPHVRSRAYRRDWRQLSVRVHVSSQRVIHSQFSDSTSRRDIEAVHIGSQRVIHSQFGELSKLLIGASWEDCFCE